MIKSRLVGWSPWSLTPVLMSLSCCPLEFGQGLWLASNWQNGAEVMGCTWLQTLNYITQHGSFMQLESLPFSLQLCRTKLLYCELPMLGSSHGKELRVAFSHPLVRNRSLQHHSHKKLNPINKSRPFSSWASDETSLQPLETLAEHPLKPRSDSWLAEAVRCQASAALW
jgi:hypothetical protein